MARPLNKKLNKVIEDYKTGEYSINDLGKKYKIDKGYLSRYFRANGITNGKLPNTIISNKRKEELKEAHNEIIVDKEKVEATNRIIINESKKEQQKSDDTGQIVESSKDECLPDVYDYTEKQFENIQGISDEIIKLVKQRNAHFAKGFQTLSAMLIQKASEILQGEKITSADLNNIAKTIQMLNDTLGVFPKLPNFAQQININQNQNKNKKIVGAKNFNLNVEFVEAKKIQDETKREQTNL